MDPNNNSSMNSNKSVLISVVSHEESVIFCKRDYFSD